MDPPKVNRNEWYEAERYAYKRAKDEDEHDDDIICGWWEKEYEFLCDAAGLEPYIYE